MSIGAIVAATFAALTSVIVYAYQKHQDRVFSIMAERRIVYTEFVEAVAPSMYMRVLVNLPEHHERLRLLNKAGGKLQVIAPPSVNDKASELIGYLRSKIANRHDDEIPDFFDEKAGKLFDDILNEGNAGRYFAAENAVRPTQAPVFRGA
ncbi:hypothetical protein [Limimaricola cinnabarinus]|uniref:hypothetical protein n=1 Tax=Limimaricola cinnabarinus TaxID=1125964 RepID=UPI00104088F5|nr:hypothetical protein [Limimaricola cinnabarinus]